MENALEKAQKGVRNFHKEHPYIYAACKWIIHEGIHYGLDACGTLIGDPLLFEEIEAIYHGAKRTAHITYKLYHYLKKKQDQHRHKIEYMAHHEQGNAQGGQQQRQPQRQQRGQQQLPLHEVLDNYEGNYEGNEGNNFEGNQDNEGNDDCCQCRLR